MKLKSLILTLLMTIFCSFIYADYPKHEFRATWFTTVGGLDWPKTTNVNQQKNNLIDMLDKMKAGNMNAVLFQVRGRSDAFYQSSYEPWASELTGTLGKHPGYDPLAFAIEEAHKRGMELHIWVNPFRLATHESNRKKKEDILRLYTAPAGKESLQWEWVTTYAKSETNDSLRSQIIDPGFPAARKYLINVLMEIINEYDVDGIVMDDYFYAYGGTTTEDAKAQSLYYNPSKVVDFNNDGDKLDDWRRSNVDSVIKNLYDTIQVTKPWVRLGMGTGGVWSTQNSAYNAYGLTRPTTINGASDPYRSLYCNPIEWIKNGWVDYVNPQIYWSTSTTVANYTVLCKWWANVCEQFSNKLPNNQRIHFFVSQSIYKAVNLEKGFESGVGEMQNQIDVNRSNLSSGTTGSVFFRTEHYLAMRDELTASHFTHTSLVPPMTWKSTKKLAAPMNLEINGTTLSWESTDAERFTIYIYPTSTTFETAKATPKYLKKVVYGKSTSLDGYDLQSKTIAVCSYDRYGVEHAVAYYNHNGEDNNEDNDEEDNEEIVNVIQYELNGGRTNLYGWMSKSDMFETFKEDAYISLSYTLDELKSMDSNDAITTICRYLSAAAVIKVFSEKQETKWGWLKDYIKFVHYADTTAGYLTDTISTDNTEAACWRYAVAAFFVEGQRISWPYTADYSVAGKDSAYIQAWKYGYDNPTSPSSTFTLNAPYKEGHIFQGWYANADFSGERVITVNEDSNLTLYAKWQGKPYTITTVMNYADVEITTCTHDTQYGDSLVIVASDKEGYHFSHWEKDPYAVPIKELLAMMFKRDYISFFNSTQTDINDPNMSHFLYRGFYYESIDFRPLLKEPRWIWMAEYINKVSLESEFTLDSEVKWRYSVAAFFSENEGNPQFNVDFTQAGTLKYYASAYREVKTEDTLSILVLEDATYTAFFNKNSYSVITTCDPTHGTTIGDTTLFYLDEAMVEATANNGYRFLRWEYMPDNVPEKDSLAMMFKRDYISFFNSTQTDINDPNMSHFLYRGFYYESIDFRPLLKEPRWIWMAEYINKVSLESEFTLDSEVKWRYSVAAFFSENEGNPQFNVDFTQAGTLKYYASAYKGVYTENPLTFIITKDITLIAVFMPEIVSNVNMISNHSTVKKLYRNGQIFILRNGKVYNIMGYKL